MNLLKTSLIAITASALSSSVTLDIKPASRHFVHKTSQQNSDAALLNDLNALCIKQLRASAIASQQGGTKAGDWGSRLSVTLNKFNDEIRVLAKNKKVVLSSALPEGGQRPDGRVDSSPENLRDTSRIKNGGGEAGYEGTKKVESIGGINDAASNALIESLKKLKGNAFDKAYQNLLISDRQTAQTLLTKAAQSSDRDVKTFASKYLQKLNSAKL
ncbi:hypothetical protein AB669_00165 [Pedobacter sp. BMA]|nr:hypothetical protein AB669_00165 [Pedobacter sp. BMA]